MKLPLRIANQQCLNVSANQSQMEMVRGLKVIQENLARDLHDDLSQYITTLSLYITGILSSKNLESAQNYASEMKAINSEMNFSLKRLLANLRSKNCLNNFPPIVSKEDYLNLLKNWEKLNSSTLLEYRIDIPSHLDTLKLSQCYQILKEALVNISRHAHAKQVSVHIANNISSLQIQISDDGLGFKTTNLDEYKFGLLGMRERAKLIGGVITLSSVPNHGTTIHLHVPLEMILHE